MYIANVDMGRRFFSNRSVALSELTTATMANGSYITDFRINRLVGKFIDNGV